MWPTGSFRAPSVEETIEILKGVRERYEEHHKLTITDEALKAAAQLAARYVADRFLPSSERRRDDRDPQGRARTLRGAPQADDYGRSVEGCCRAGRALCGRPVPAELRASKRRSRSSRACANATRSTTS